MEAAGYQLIVAGAGPAGSACAITAARAGLKVLLLEKDHFPRQKVCGEFVSFESLDLLQRLLGERLHPPADAILPALETSSAIAYPAATEYPTAEYPKRGRARISIDGTAITWPIHPAAQSIPRFDLDIALFRAAQHAGVDAKEGMNIMDVQRGEKFLVRTASQTFSASAVVNTTGRWSKLTQFDVTGKDRWIGLKAHFRESSPSPSVDLYFFPGGYCGVTPVGPDSINACAMVRSDLARSLEDVFCKEPALFARSRAWQPVFPTVTTSPLYFRAPETTANGMLLAGDAAGFIDPFAGDGISLALQSGTLAGAAIAQFIHGTCSLEAAQQLYHAGYCKQFAPAFRNAARLRRALAAPKWLRNAVLPLARIPGIGALLVRSTRARVS